MEQEKITTGDDISKSLQKAIVEVVAFFDLFDYPLTELEIWEFLGLKCEFIDIKEILDSGAMADRLETKNGFYYLQGREDIIVTRMMRYNYACRKFKRAVLVGKIFKIVPWIKMVGVGNVMGANNLKDESDIDLFIITEKNRVWLTRVFCVVITMLLGWRPSDKVSRDKICLSFFVSEEGMDLRGLMLSETVTHPVFGSANASSNPPLSRGDYYFICWLACLTPVYDVGGVYEKLIGANTWIHEVLPNWYFNLPAAERRAGDRWPALYHDISDLLFGGLETVARKWQIKRLPAKLKEMMNKDTRVVVSDDVIKLHSNDRREEYNNKFREKINRIFNF